MDELQRLNADQRRAVTATEGYIRVIAGAGSGKTKTLITRFAYLVNDLFIPPSNILCVTFTNKAANEMKKRIRSITGGNDMGYVCTFHGFCVQLLREDIHVIEYPKSFGILDEADSKAILNTVYANLGISQKNYTFNSALDFIEALKNDNQHIQLLINADINDIREKYENEQSLDRKIFLGYLYEQRKCYGLDFNDLISFAMHILNNFDDIRTKWQKRLMYIMVDEFQDVSLNQYTLVDLLSGYHKNLFVVGDPDQTIYSWRGANVNFILNFDINHTNTQTIILNKNYRSTPNILNAGNSLISKNKNRIKKDLTAVRSEGIPVIYTHSKKAADEAALIADKIMRLKAAGGKYGDNAVLYRSHFSTRSIEEAFVKKRIPYAVYSGMAFYQRKEIKDVLSYLRLLINGDDISFKRIVNVPLRKIGKKRIEFLEDYADKNNCTLYNALCRNIYTKMFSGTGAEKFVILIEKYRDLCGKMTASDILADIIGESGYENMLRTQGDQERLDNLSELKQSVFEYEKNSGEENTLSNYLQDIALYTNTDRSEKGDFVKMMTIHTAKGLEFDNVFVCGLNEGIFPNKHIRNIDEMEEERRLAYVACTRAKNRLFLSDSEGFNFDDSYRYPSRFIFNIDKKYIKYASPLSEDLITGAEKYIANDERKYNANDKKIGDEINHPAFGKGKIIDVKDDFYVVKFEKIATPRNIRF